LKTLDVLAGGGATALVRSDTNKGRVDPVIWSAFLKKSFFIIALSFLAGCIVSEETNPGLAEPWNDRETKAMSFEERLWEEHRGFPTFSTRVLPEQELREVFVAFAELLPDGAYVLGSQTRFYIEFEYSNSQRLGQLRTATYQVAWHERDSNRLLYSGTASTICQFSDAIIARPPDCEDVKSALLLTALLEMK
jgi:hypothetical protein